MKPRSSASVAVAAASLLAFATGCSSAHSTPQGKPTAAVATSSPAIARYLSLFRGMPLPEFSPRSISDAKLIAVGREACSDLTTHTPAEVLTILEHEGWSRGDGSAVIACAAGGETLCPQTQAVRDWEMTVVNAGPYPS